MGCQSEQAQASDSDRQDGEECENRSEPAILPVLEVEGVIQEEVLEMVNQVDLPPYLPDSLYGSADIRRLDADGVIPDIEHPLITVMIKDGPDFFLQRLLVVVL